MIAKRTTIRGRPRTSKDGGKRHRRSFSVSDAEYTYIQQLAADYEQTVSELIRDCLLVDMPETRTSRENEPLGIVGNARRRTP